MRQFQRHGETDASGAVPPGAQISIPNAATGTRKNLASDQHRIYNVPRVPARKYEVRISANRVARNTELGKNIVARPANMTNPDRATKARPVQIKGRSCFESCPIVPRRPAMPRTRKSRVAIVPTNKKSQNNGPTLEVPTRQPSR